jgi:PAS domain S-box-containing protein
MKTSGVIIKCKSSIRNALIAITLLIGIGTLVTAFSLFTVFHFKDLRSQKTTSVQILARSVAAGASAAIAYSDERAAKDILEGLSADQTIESAFLVTADGQLFVQRGEHPFKNIKMLESQGQYSYPYIDLRQLIVYEEVSYKGAAIGGIYVVSSLADINDRLLESVAMMFIIILFTSSIAFVVASWMQSKISNPIVKLATIMRRVSKTRDYSTRADISAFGEVDTLTEGFNDMLEEIDTRDRQLERARQDLEERVVQRTQELSLEIKERLNVEEALRREQLQLRTIFANAPIAIAMLDTNMNFLVHSGYWLKDYKLEGASIVGKSYYEILPHTPERWKQIHRKALSGITEHFTEDSVIAADGTTNFLRWTCQPWYRADGALGGILMVSMPIDELVHARESALKVAKIKSEFVANVSHELRTPLNAIIGFSELLMEELKTPNEYLATIASSARLLLALINDILDFSKAESGKLILERLTFSLSQLAEETLKMFSLDASKKGIALTAHIDEALTHCRIHSDPMRIRQVLLNLLNNAIKFTKEGEVSLTIKTTLVGPRNIKCSIEVKDTGIGIPPEKQKNIFEAFSQADGSTTRIFGGTGLGLAISARLVAVMGGVLRCESTKGLGSTFSFEAEFECQFDQANIPQEHSPIPSPQLLAPQPIPPATVAPASTRILVAEDNKVNQKLLKILLSKEGFNVEIADNGLEAYEALRKEKFDIVFMDLQMPVLDGISAAIKIRASESENFRVPIIALTAHAFAEDELRCIEAGMNGFLTKPIDKNKIMSVIQRWCSAR